MSKHKSEDYKLSAVKYYLNNEVSLDDVYIIFYCPKHFLLSQIDLSVAFIKERW